MKRKPPSPGKLKIVPHLLRRWYWGLAVALLLLVWLGVALAMRPIREADGSFGSRPYGLTTAMENRTLDLMFQLRNALRPEVGQRGYKEPITIIEVDEASIRQSNIRLQKWPRNFYARLVDRAREGGAKVVGLDLYLSEAGGISETDKAADEQMVESLYNTENVVIVQKLEAGGVPAIVPLPMFEEVAEVGFADLPHDGDNAVRSSMLVRQRPGEEPQFSFATQLARLYTGDDLKPEGEDSFRLGDRVIPLRTDTALQLDFRNRTPGFTRVSAGDILCADFKAVSAPDIQCDESRQPAEEVFRDRVVLIGATNNDAPDLFVTPFYEPMALARALDTTQTTSPARMPGVEIHATALATMLFGQSPIRPDYARSAAMILVPLFFVALGVFLLRALWGLMLVLGVAAVQLVVSVWVFNNYSVALPLASGWVGVGSLSLLGFVLRYAHERAVREEKEAERAQIMDIFSRCVDPSVAEELYSKRGNVTLGGESRVVTLIFTDIRGFTTLTEKAESSAQVVEWLNEYFTRMHRIIRHYGGHINKYIGDGLMIVFGAPVDRGATLEARAAVTCGLEMLAEIDEINKDWEGTGRPHIAIGVGIHTGQATCGVVGAPGRLEYTIIGDAVNLAARLESTTKEAGVPLLASSATVEMLGQDYEVEPLGDVKVKGKNISTAIYGVKKKGFVKTNLLNSSLAGVKVNG